MTRRHSCAEGIPVAQLENKVHQRYDEACKSNKKTDECSKAQTYLRIRSKAQHSNIIQGEKVVL